MGIYTKPGFTEKTIYDLFRHLVNAASFTSQTEKEEFLHLIDKCESVNMFGTTAEIIKSEERCNVQR